MTFLELYWRPLLAGLVVGAAAPAIGTFIVQRRLSLVGDGIGHVAFAGVAVGIAIGAAPLPAALVAAVLGAIGIDALRRRDPEEADMALALFFYGSIALAVVASSVGGGFGNLLAFLFGQVLTVTNAELVTIVGLGAAVLAGVAALYRGFVSVAIDEEAALVAGLPVAGLNVTLMVLTALTIGLGMIVVGILLIAALMVLPVGVARNVAQSFRGALLVASGVGAFAAVAGIGIAYRADTAPSGTIVLLVAALFAVSDVARIARSRRARRREATA